ncbi:hypothetical protein BJ508DRAFT_321395 [Ascobolus immersus RN42]|uniref:Uncharacterized protein n=1 Tax=Ascobolus immersus RN42 TaxID=1160509 RepID=A0A3N4IYT5_ASCIM|nr:hypothetical protein BJ508DRAFT_321395 [Ascobolus immersus RN42]
MDGQSLTTARVYYNERRLTLQLLANKSQSWSKVRNEIINRLEKQFEKAFDIQEGCITLDRNCDILWLPDVGGEVIVDTAEAVTVLATRAKTGDLRFVLRARGRPLSTCLRSVATVASTSVENAPKYRDLPAVPIPPTRSDQVKLTVYYAEEGYSANVVSQSSNSMDGDAEYMSQATALRNASVMFWGSILREIDPVEVADAEGDGGNVATATLVMRFGVNGKIQALVDFRKATCKKSYPLPPSVTESETEVQVVEKEDKEKKETVDSAIQAHEQKGNQAQTSSNEAVAEDLSESKTVSNSQTQAAESGEAGEEESQSIEIFLEECERRLEGCLNRIAVVADSMSPEIKSEVVELAEEMSAVYLATKERIQTLGNQNQKLLDSLNPITNRAIIDKARAAVLAALSLGKWETVIASHNGNVQSVIETVLQKINQPSGKIGSAFGKLHAIVLRSLMDTARDRILKLGGILTSWRCFLATHNGDVQKATDTALEKFMEAIPEDFDIGVGREFLVYIVSNNHPFRRIFYSDLDHTSFLRGKEKLATGVLGPWKEIAAFIARAEELQVELGMKWVSPDLEVADMKLRALSFGSVV